MLITTGCTTRWKTSSAEAAIGTHWKDDSPPSTESYTAKFTTITPAQLGRPASEIYRPHFPAVNTQGGHYGNALQAASVKLYVSCCVAGSMYSNFLYVDVRNPTSSRFLLLTSPSQRVSLSGRLRRSHLLAAKECNPSFYINDNMESPTIKSPQMHITACCPVVSEDGQQHRPRVAVRVPQRKGRSTYTIRSHASTVWTMSSWCNRVSQRMHWDWWIPYQTPLEYLTNVSRCVYPQRLRMDADSTLHSLVLSVEKQNDWRRRSYAFTGWIAQVWVTGMWLPVHPHCCLRVPAYAKTGTRVYISQSLPWVRRVEHFMDD